MRLASLLMCATGLLAADEKKPAPPAGIELARSAPPEFFADTVVRWVRLGRVPGREMQAQLLEDAFQAAARAKEPVRLIAIPSTPPDTREMYRGKAGALGMDALSLEARIVNEMLTLDRGRAREMFAAIPRPALDPRPCEDALIADASPYYEMAGAIAQSAFSEREKKDEAHIQFLEAILAGARSPNEIAPFTKALESVELTRSEMDLLLAAIASKLGTMGADYRAFAISRDSTEAELERLMETARANGTAVDGLLQGFRRYLVNQLNAPRCAPEIASGADPDWVAALRYTDDIGPADRGKGMESHAYFASGDAARMGALLTELRVAPREQWSAKFADFLSEYAAWQPEGSAIDAFHQRATLLRALLQIAKGRQDADRVAGLCVELLSSGIDRDFPGEWLWEMKAMVEAAPSIRQDLLESARRSGKVSIGLYLGP